MIVKEQNIPRNKWKLAKVVNKDDVRDWFERLIQMGQRDLGKKGECVKQLSVLERPVQKLVVLVPNELA